MQAVLIRYFKQKIKFVFFYMNPLCFISTVSSSSGPGWNITKCNWASNNYIKRLFLWLPQPSNWSIFTHKHNFQEPLLNKWRSADGYRRAVYVGTLFADLSPNVRSQIQSLRNSIWELLTRNGICGASPKQYCVCDVYAYGIRYIVVWIHRIRYILEDIFDGHFKLSGVIWWSTTIGK